MAAESDRVVRMVAGRIDDPPTLVKRCRPTAAALHSQP